MHDAARFESLWAATAGAPPATESLSDAISTDVVIVGGGYTGLSTALHLAEQGVGAVVLEAQEVGHGASGRNGGQVNPGLKYDPPALLSKFGEEAAKRMISFSGGAPDYLFDLVRRTGISCDAQQRGWVITALDETSMAALSRRAASWDRWGGGLKMLDRSQSARLLGTDIYAGALLDPRGGSVQPLSLARGLARAAIASGAKIYSRSQATEVVRAGSNWLVKTSAGSVRAEHVVLATNGYTDGLWPGLQKSIIATNSFQVATAPLGEIASKEVLPEGNTVTDSRRIILYYRRDAAGRFILGGRGRFGQPASTDDFAHLYRAVARIFPVLKGVPFQHHWSGRVAMTVDGFPHVHELAPGVLAVLGYNGRGVALSTAMGGAIAGYVRGNSEALPFKPARLRTIPLHALQRYYIAAAFGIFKLRDAMKL